MEKRNRILITILILLIAGALAYKSGFRPFTFVPLSSDLGECKAGWTTLSIDKVDIVGEGDRIRIYGVAKGSECLKIAFSKEQLDKYLNPEGYEATKPIHGNIKLLEYTKTFPIDKIGEYKLVGMNKVVDGTRDEANLRKPTIQDCRNHGINNAIYAYKPFQFYNIRCVIPETAGWAGDFSAARSYGDFKVLFQIGDYSTTLDRSNLKHPIGSGSVDLAGGRARIEWVGNLNNLDEVYPPQHDARLIESKWRLVKDGALGDVNSKIDSFINCMNSRANGVYISDSDFDYCKAKYNPEIEEILKDRTEEYKERMSDLIYDLTTDNNALHMSLKAPPFPTFIIDLDAEWAGIVPLKGKPSITQCIPNQELESGITKRVTFKVKNNADNEAEFYASLKCDDGLIGYIPSFSIGKNEEKTITAELIPSNPRSSDLRGTCQLRVDDLKSDNYDTCGFAFKVKYSSGITCTPNELYCDSEFKNVVKCKQDGKSKELYQECTYGCEYVNGKPKCKSEPELGECKSCFEWLNNKISPGKCKPAKYVDKWYLPNSIESKFTQDAFCPFILLFYVIFGLLSMVIIFLVIKLIIKSTKK